MGDGPSGGGVCSPGIAIVKCWQGIVEMIIRVVILILNIIVLICACTSAAFTAQFADMATPELVRSTEATSGWLAFISFVAIIFAVLFFILRFLNCGILVNNATITHIVDLVVNVVLAVGILCGCIPLAVYIRTWVVDHNFYVVNHVAAAGFGFLTIIVYIVLIVWMIVSLLLKWPNIIRSK